MMCDEQSEHLRNAYCHFFILLLLKPAHIVYLYMLCCVSERETNISLSCWYVTLLPEGLHCLLPPYLSWCCIQAISQGINILSLLCFFFL